MTMHRRFTQIAIVHGIAGSTTDCNQSVLLKYRYNSHPCQQMASRLVVMVKNTRNSSGDEIANVNFLYDDIVHVLQNTIDSCINSATGRRGYVLERMRLPNSVKYRNITAITSFKVIQGRQFWYKS